MKSVTIRNRRWTLGRCRGRGERGGCEGPHVPGRILDIPIHGRRLEDLNTIIHEALHAALWDLDEDSVKETADGVAWLLWRCGWRKINTGGAK
jgi:hypothetical protein